MSMASDEFTARLARVKANEGRSIIMVGQDESFVHERKRPVQRSRKREVAGNMGYPASLAGAFLLGMVAVALGYYARFHVMSGHAEMENPDLEMLLAGFIGICVAFALSQMFRLTSKEHKAMQSAGVFLMIGAFHNLFFWAPGVMGVVFSPDYVLQSTMTAQPNSFRFRGTYIPLIEQTYAVPAADPAAAGSAATGLSAEPATSCASAPVVKRIEVTGERRKAVTPSAGAATCP